MKRIVVADDDLDILSLIANTLEARGYQVLPARDGQQAWQSIAGEHPDAAILDINMPVINGFDLCRKIRADRRTRHIGVMFLTARENVADKVTGFEVGADDYLVKPFQPRELLVRVTALLRRAEAIGTKPPVTSPEENPGQVIALFGAKGGVGTSVLATNLAVAIASMNQTVSLVDLDLEHAIDAMLLDVVPKRTGTIVDLSSTYDAATTDWNSVEQYLVTHKSSKVRVLAGPTTPAHAELVTGEHVRAFLGMLRQHHKYVLVDLSSSFRDINLDTFDICDKILLVLVPELPAVKAMHGVADVMRQLGVSPDMLQVVVNQPAPTTRLTIDDVKRAVGLPVAASIPHGGEEFINSVNQGTPIVLMKPQHPTSLAIKKLAETLVPVPEESKATVR